MNYGTFNNRVLLEFTHHFLYVCMYCTLSHAWLLVSQLDLLISFFYNNKKKIKDLNVLICVNYICVMVRYFLCYFNFNFNYKVRNFSTEIELN